MKVVFNNLYSKTISPISTHRKNISFCAKHAACIKFSDIKKISSESEYDSVIKELKNSGNWSGWWEVGNKFDKGLMPYIGREDISFRINHFLRNGGLIDNKYTENALKNIIRVFDYALDETDKVYGRYSGIVYRYGIVDKDSKNYVSTAEKAEGLGNIIPEEDKHLFKNPFYIIKVKNGHKAEEIQKKLNYNNVYTEESEIIIKPASFQEINEPNAEMKKAEINLKNTLHKYHFHAFPKIIFLEELD